jgi:phosphatidylglycerol:prolipoprotein diacylglycerol transferase
MGQALGRVGCFLNGCCYGKVDAGRGVVFPNLEDNLPHLPVQLYETAACLALSLFLVWFLPRRRFTGQVTLVYVALYAVLRFLLEFLRGDAERGTLLLPWLWPSQWIAVAAVAAAGYFYFRIRRGNPR